MKYGLDVTETQYRSQILVVGAGGAGLSAAVAAAEKGADVILIEKRRIPGGNTALAGGMFSARPHGPMPNEIDLTEDELFLLGMDFAHWTINPRLMRAWISKSSDTLDWLEHFGIKFSQTFENEKTRRKFFNMYIPPVQYVPNGYGSGLIQSLYRIFQNFGGRMFFQTAAKDLILNENGTIGGVLAEHNGEEIRFEASNVILATGDFGANQELMRKYCRYYRDNIWSAVEETVGMCAMVFIILTGGRIFSRFLTISGLSQVAVNWITRFVTADWQLIAALVVLYLILGCFLEANSIIMITIPVVYPAVQAMGINPIWFGMVLILALHAGMLTPPLGLVVYSIKSVAEHDVTLEDIFTGIWPFLAMVLLCTALVIIFPAIATWLPSVMYQ